MLRETKGSKLSTSSFRFLDRRGGFPRDDVIVLVAKGNVAAKKETGKERVWQNCNGRRGGISISRSGEPWQKGEEKKSTD